MELILSDSHGPNFCGDMDWIGHVTLDIKGNCFYSMWWSRIFSHICDIGIGNRILSRTYKIEIFRFDKLPAAIIWYSGVSSQKYFNEVRAFLQAWIPSKINYVSLGNILVAFKISISLIIRWGLRSDSKICIKAELSSK